MADAHNGIKRSWYNGGELLVGSDTVKNIVKGSVECDVPGAKEMMQEDRGIIGDSLTGGDRPCTGKIILHLAKLLTASGTGALELAGVVASGKYLNWDTTTGKLIQKQIVIKIPAFRGASTGESITFPKCVFPEGIKYKSGQDEGENFDTLEIAFKHLGPSPDFAAY